MMEFGICGVCGISGFAYLELTNGKSTSRAVLRYASISSATP